VSVLGGGDPSSSGAGIQSPFQPGQTGAVSQQDLAQVCRTGADANARDDCRIVAYTNSVQQFWARAMGSRYQPAQTIIFSGAVQTGCGNATSDVGPFYCPADGKAYFDLGFFNELQTRFGAQGGSFAQGYVVAHEYGHHIQNLLGTSDRVGRRDRSGERVGAAGAAGRLLRRRLGEERDDHDGANGRPLFESVSQSDINNALDAAAAVGDDRIQSRSAGPGVPGELHPRNVGPAAEVVHHRLPDRQPQLLRHLQRQHLSRALLGD
jgi:predicted metalloprotease